MTVYLLHFEQKIGNKDNPRGQAQHYLGYAGVLHERLEDHAAGHGARLTQVLKEKGIGWCLVRTWAGTRELERQLKNRHESNRLCPLCNPRQAQHLHKSARKQMEPF